MCARSGVSPIMSWLVLTLPFGHLEVVTIHLLYTLAILHLTLYKVIIIDEANYYTTSVGARRGEASSGPRGVISISSTLKRPLTSNSRLKKIPLIYQSMTTTTHPPMQPPTTVQKRRSVPGDATRYNTQNIAIVQSALICESQKKPLIRCE